LNFDVLQCTALGGAQFDNADGGDDAADSTSNVADLANNLGKWAFEHFEHYSSPLGRGLLAVDMKWRFSTLGGRRRLGGDL